MYDWTTETIEIAGRTTRLSPRMTQFYADPDLAVQVNSWVRGLPDEADCRVGRLIADDMPALPIIVFRHGAEIRVKDVMVEPHGSDCAAATIERHAAEMTRESAALASDPSSALWLTMAATTHRMELAERMYKFPLAETRRIVEAMRAAGTGPAQSNDALDALAGGRESSAPCCAGTASTGGSAASKRPGR